MKNLHKRSSGFTLVEIAIVLVIVGLLIGGILVARSMMNTAQIGAMTRQVGQYDIAIEQFQEKFRGLPGDSSKFYASGDNDGKIEDGGATNGKGSLFAGEVANFWVNLETATQIKVSGNTPTQQFAQGQVIDFNNLEPATGNRFSATITGNLKNRGATINIPPAKIGDSKTGVLVTNDYLDPSNPNSLTTRKLEGAYILANFEGVNNDSEELATNLAASIKPADALALDTKLDDGVANTGVVIALPETASCNTDGDYATSTNSEVCALAVGYLRLHDAKTSAADAADVCGDGFTTGSEECDDGNLVDLDGCSQNCYNETDCGCGWTENCYSSPGAACDNFGVWNECTDTCDCSDTDACGTYVWDGNSCEPPTTYPDPGGCFNGGTYEGTWDACNNTCICPGDHGREVWTGSDCVPTPVCGNEDVEFGETCDDGGSNGSCGMCNSSCTGLEDCGI
jgi:prepilin-type N-terminal cleavage/methylation domain-containing protein